MLSALTKALRPRTSRACGVNVCSRRRGDVRGGRWHVLVDLGIEESVDVGRLASRSRSSPGSDRVGCQQALILRSLEAPAPTRRWREAAGASRPVQEGLPLRLGQQAADDQLLPRRVTVDVGRELQRANRDSSPSSRSISYRGRLQ